MKKAVQPNDPTYRFSATYYGKHLGYFIDKLNGTASSGSCYWAVYVEAADGSTKLSNVGVSSLTIPNKESLLMKYQSSDCTP